MTQEDITPETPEQPEQEAPPQPKAKKPEPEAVLPDGMGISLEQAKALIAKHHKMILANDEPSLMGLTICNAYLGEVEKLHARHEKGLTRLMAEKTDEYVSGVQAAVNQLSASLSEVAPFLNR